MGRYKERETTTFPDSILPPEIAYYSFEIEDTKTGKVGEGVGDTKKQARDLARENLEYKNWEDSILGRGSTGGGGGGGASIDSGWGEVLGWLAFPFIFLIFVCFALFILDKGIEQVESGIQRIVPRFETRQNQAERGKRELQQDKDFFTGSERQLIVTENKPVLPQARLVFLAEGKDKKKRVTRINPDGTGRAVATNISVNQYNDKYDMKWMPTGKTSGNSMSRAYHYRSSPVPSSNGEKLAYFEGETVSYHWGTSSDSVGQVVLKDLATKTEKKISGAYFKSMGTMTPQAWSPDGSKLAIGVYAKRGYQVVQIIDLGRRGKRYLLSVLGRNPSWSPDGNWIAFDYKGEVFIFEIGAVDPKTIKSRPSDGHFTGSETSPIARSNIIRIGAGEKPFWEKGTYSSKATPKSESQSTSKLRSLSAQGINITTQGGQRVQQSFWHYCCTADNYNPDEWRITPKSVSRTFDGGKTWLIIWELKGNSRYSIRRMEAMDSRSEVELLPPGERDIYLIIDER